MRARLPFYRSPARLLKVAASMYAPITIGSSTKPDPLIAGAQPAERKDSIPESK
ncbi:hypothetical protein [Reyranella sp.]|uniref:hypothetical protein n=1 Tax=Reyranella sp. TaxID=1929291 RepID=UPI00378469D0